MRAAVQHGPRKRPATEDSGQHGTITATENTEDAERPGPRRTRKTRKTDTSFTEVTVARRISRYDESTHSCRAGSGRRGGGGSGCPGSGPGAAQRPRLYRGRRTSLGRGRGSVGRTHCGGRNDGRDEGA